MCRRAFFDIKLFKPGKILSENPDIAINEEIGKVEYSYLFHQILVGHQIRIVEHLTAFLGAMADVIDLFLRRYMKLIAEGIESAMIMSGANGEIPQSITIKLTIELRCS